MYNIESADWDKWRVTFHSRVKLTVVVTKTMPLEDIIRVKVAVA
jgi:hypothetical protein